MYQRLEKLLQFSKTDTIYIYICSMISTISLILLFSLNRTIVPTCTDRYPYLGLSSLTSVEKKKVSTSNLSAMDVVATNIKN